MIAPGHDILQSVQASFADDFARQMHGRIAIVGLPEVGKKTLYNSLIGWQAVNGSAERIQQLGLFSLVELSSDAYDTAGTLYRLENADLIVYVLDGRHELSAEDFNWIARLRSIEATLLVVLNFADALPRDQEQQRVSQYEERLARPVLPLAANQPEEVRERLLRAMLKVCPHLAVPLANELPSLRAQVARHVVLQSAANCVTIGLQGEYTPDLETYTGLQLSMIRQIAAIYGYKGRDRYRERLGLTMGLRWALHVSLPLMNRYTFVQRWLSSGMVSAALTLFIGYMAVLGYGGYLPRWLIRFTPYVGNGRHGSTKSTPR